MLDLLDEALESFLRAAVPLGADVAVSFDAPDRDWAARLSGRPTVNLYLWDVRRNLGEQEAGEVLTTGPDGRRTRRGALPRVDCRYLVTAFTSEVRDEHALLGRALAALLRETEIDARLLPEPIAAVRPLPSVRIAASDGRDNSDFWSALGGQLKAGLDLLVTATIDAVPLPQPAGPDVVQRVLRLHDKSAATLLETINLPNGGTDESLPGAAVPLPE
ncbi:hypothetical protein ACWT_2101 [Actinoplanes sp. SE50]|uniref:DUF4255 domain-containing protein n=1 Tax=unclassified Actinoplanes TaxID=2626549 RepID=UPI00023EC77A|nr:MULTISPECIES: DUF4255 domain-containing protein [unclassified Actinoplanes]AEV83121.1 hypothetical protein ACPL_2224 [Actinoplanes sp. SE50/110]ATO81516.1 hypothetical protein ACWT_2101 [Actinoplanes sp. SE50]SLL98923.1 hypothetical protein ACSP50_2150 [Actinoplanes sp. SE50/110]